MGCIDLDLLRAGTNSVAGIPIHSAPLLSSRPIYEPFFLPSPPGSPGEKGAGRIPYQRLPLEMRVQRIWREALKPFHQRTEKGAGRTQSRPTVQIFRASRKEALQEGKARELRRFEFGEIRCWSVEVRLHPSGLFPPMQLFRFTRTRLFADGKSKG